MKKVLALVVAAAMGLSSAAFAAETATTPAPTATTTKAAPAKTTHHKKQHKATRSAIPKGNGAPRRFTIIKKDISRRFPDSHSCGAPWCDRQEKR